MKVLNFGSLNVDKVYTVAHFVKPGETISSLDYAQHCGGKGLNQSIALKKAGIETVYHAGKIAPDGTMLKTALSENNVNTQFVLEGQGYTGHAIIQVEQSGQNNIILFGGTNVQITPTEVDQVLAHFEKGDLVLLQNEISSMAYIIEKSAEKGLIVVLNPSPITPQLLEYPLDKVNIFLMNEIESHELSGEEDPDKAIVALSKKYPHAQFVITLGKEGVKYFDGTNTHTQKAHVVKAVDTTAAGDTFTGYFLAGYIQKLEPQEILKTATKASALAVMKQGAAESIPTYEQVMQSNL